MTENQTRERLSIFRCPQCGYITPSVAGREFDTCPRWSQHDPEAPPPRYESIEVVPAADLARAEAEGEGLRRALAAAQPKVEWQAQIMELEAERERAGKQAAILWRFVFHNGGLAHLIEAPGSMDRNDIVRAGCEILAELRAALAKEGAETDG
jgi:hypothetical protein